MIQGTTRLYCSPAQKGACQFSSGQWVSGFVVVVVVVEQDGRTAAVQGERSHLLRLGNRSGNLHSRRIRIPASRQPLDEMESGMVLLQPGWLYLSPLAVSLPLGNAGSGSRQCEQLVSGPWAGH